MLFNSITFFVFLLIIFAVYWKTVKKSEILSRIVLLAGSYIFYGWWDWRFLILIIISSFSDYLLGQFIHDSTNRKKQKLLLFISITVNIGILFIFKYYNFFVDSFMDLTGISLEENAWNSLNVILPVGISFYTFQTLSYTIDIYNGKIKPTKSWLTFFTFVAFFPQLVAGPIERAKKLIPQFEKRPVFSHQMISSGLKLILWGLFKKMVIADQFSVIVDAVYSNPENFNGTGILLATLFFGFQIYCDFSGYSDIAIGTARLFGINLMINFQTPYFSVSFRQFWHRWHISLSTWFRDYIYIPLGGNKGTMFKWARNILITFIISGLWHGANTTFLIWGAIHGAFYIFEQFISPTINIKPRFRNFLGFLITFILVNLSWIFFRAESWFHIKHILNTVVSGGKSDFSTFSDLIYKAGHLTESGRMLIFSYPIFIITDIIIRRNSFSDLFANSPRIVRWSYYYILVLSILLFGVLNTAPQFIYFQF